MQKTRELMDVPHYEGEKIVIKRLNNGEQSDVNSKSLNIDVKASNRKNPKVGVNLDVFKMRNYRMAYAIVQAPFFVNDGQPVNDYDKRYEIVRELEQETADYLNGEIEELNKREITEELEKK